LLKAWRQSTVEHLRNNPEWQHFHILRWMQQAWSQRAGAVQLLEVLAYMPLNHADGLWSISVADRRLSDRTHAAPWSPADETNALAHEFVHVETGIVRWRFDVFVRIFEYSTQLGGMC
jgi:hypothetical protein